MSWTATVSNCDNYPQPEKPLILHIHDNRMGATDVASETALIDFVKANPGIGFVNVYDSRFPRKPVTWEKFVEKHASKLWPGIKDRLAAV